MQVGDLVKHKDGIKDIGLIVEYLGVHGLYKVRWLVSSLLTCHSIDIIDRFIPALLHSRATDSRRICPKSIRSTRGTRK